MTSQNLPSPKPDTLPSKYIGTVLTQSEIHSLRQDLNDAYEYAIKHIKPRKLTLSKP